MQNLDAAAKVSWMLSAVMVKGSAIWYHIQGGLHSETATYQTYVHEWDRGVCYMKGRTDESSAVQACVVQVVMSLSTPYQLSPCSLCLVGT